MKDLRWCLPFDETVYVAKYGPHEFVIDHISGGGGQQYGPYLTRREAREAALELVEQIYRDNGGRRH